MTHSIHAVGRRAAKSWIGLVGAAAMLALICLAVNPQAGLFSGEEESQQISRVIAKEMTAAQKALAGRSMGRGAQGSGRRASKVRVDAVRSNVDLPFSGFANIKFNNLKAAQAAYEKALATGAVSAEDKTNMTRTLFTIAATTNQYQKTIDYGKEMADAGTATPNDVAMIAQSYYQLKDCKNSGALGRQGRRGRRARPARHPRKICSCSSCSAPPMRATTRPWFRS